VAEEVRTPMEIILKVKMVLQVEAGLAPFSDQQQVEVLAPLLLLAVELLGVLPSPQLRELVEAAVEVLGVLQEVVEVGHPDTPGAPYSHLSRHHLRRHL